MEYLAQFGYYLAIAAVFVIMISILVAAHELGHYLFARLFGMGVEEFAIGFGKKPLWTYMRRTYKVADDHHPGVENTETTDFTVRPWPLGGFVKIKGMVPEDDGSEVNIPGGFYNKPPLQRFIVLLAGPAFSVLAGILLLVPLYATVGIERRVNDPVVSNVVKDTPAAIAGIKAGDRIVAVNGKPVKTFYDYIAEVRYKPNQTIKMDLLRKGEPVSVAVTTKLSNFDTQVLDHNLDMTGTWQQQAAIGINYPEGTRFHRLSVPGAFAAAVNEPVRAVRSMIGLFTRPKNFSKNVAGPATMIAFTNYAVQQGFSKVIQLAALLSISVGIFNLLPFSPLDGGQMVVAVVEMFRRGKRLSIQVQSAISAVGMTLIAVLVLGAWFFDFKRWFGPPDVAQPQLGSSQSQK